MPPTPARVEQLETSPGPIVRVDGVEYRYFGGTAYLGLQADPRVHAAAADAIRRYGVHSATSRTRLDSPPVRAAERAAASFFGCDDAILTPTGYVCAAMLVTGMLDSIDHVLIDEHAHYCLRDAARLMQVPVTTFSHGQPEALEAELAALPTDQRALVMTDGVFASTGALAPIEHYHRILEASGGTLLVDDAHGAGCLGEQGRGVLESSGLLDRANGAAPHHRVFWCTTASKALGGHGGLVVGTRDWIDELRRSSWFAGSSAPAAAAAASTARAIDLAAAEPGRRADLRTNTIRLRAGLKRLGLLPDITTADPIAPIVALTIGDAGRMQDIHTKLRERGFLVPYARRYSGVGPEGALRVAVFATHEPQMIDALIEALGQLL